MVVRGGARRLPGPDHQESGIPVVWPPPRSGFRLRPPAEDRHVPTAATRWRSFDTDGADAPEDVSVRAVGRRIRFARSWPVLRGDWRRRRILVARGGSDSHARCDWYGIHLVD